MNLEIERKFLLNLEHWKPDVKGIPYRQGYLAITEKSVVRVRIKGDQATLTVKSHDIGISRTELEYPIPVDQAEFMLKHLCISGIIEKTRFKVEANGMHWDVDEFLGENSGLWLAEVELESEDQEVVLPEWAGKEVTDDERYYNAYISKRPFPTW